jgi:hypothetical protein
MFALQSLLSIYPDARFVQAHREPLQAITSVSSLIAILRSVFSDAVDPAQIARDALQYWSETLSVFMRERERLQPRQICDLDYREIQRDPIAAVQRIYEYFGWRLSAEAEQRMRQVLANQPREQNGFHHYEPAQFDLDPSEVEQRFSAYRARFGLSPKTISDATECAGALIAK